MSEKRASKVSKERSLSGFSLRSLAMEIGLDTELITIRQAAQIRGTTEVSVLELIQRGRLKAINISGRWFLSREGVEAFNPQTWKKK